MRRLSLTTLLVLIACLSASANAATLVGSATLNVADDLTVINDGGTILEFLDLTFTVNMTPADAVAAYAADGFSFATDDDITLLLDAFGTTYGYVPFGTFDLGASAGDRADFVSYLGLTPTVRGVASMGWLDTSGAGGGPNTRLCMSDGGCDPLSFVANTSITHPVGPPDEFVGVFLVRNVPEPTTASLLAFGLIGLAFTRRRSN